MPNLVGGSVEWNLDANIKPLSRGLEEAQDQVSKTAKEIDKEFSSLSQGIVRSFKNAEGASKQFTAGLLGIGAAIAGGVGFGVKVAADLETARQGFATLLGSVDLADKAIEQIKKDAASTPFEFSGLVRANQLLTSVTKDAGRSEKLLLNVGKALAAAGKGGEELDNVIVNLQQIANTSSISELDIRQFGFAGINILELLADQYGVTKEAAADMVKNSDDAFADLEKAFERAGGAGGRFERAFIDQAGTFNQLVSNFGDVFSQTAAEIVTNAGIFDAVKNALAGIVSALIQFQPQITQGIVDFLTFARENIPIITGAIVGGLLPALVGVFSAIAASPLLPFIAAGAALGLVINQLIESMGGWEIVSQKIASVLTLIGSVYNQFLKPAIDSLNSSISTQLIPNLQEFWRLAGPVLEPTLKLLGAVIGGVVLVSMRAFIEVLKSVVQFLNTTVQNVNNVVNIFRNLPGAISNALSGIPDAISRPFNEAWERVRETANRIRDSLDRINPYHRESPSLIDNIRSGVDVISKEFQSLSDLSFPSIAHTFAADAATTSGQNINVTIGQVNERSDIDMINREIGFKSSLAR